MIHAIQKYIKRELAKGYSLPIIREELKHKGFSEDQISSAIAGTTTPRLSIISALVLVLGLVALDGIIAGIFLFLPITMLAPLGGYVVLALIPALISLLNYWVISQNIVDDVEKNLAGFITPLPLVLLLHNVLTFKTLLPATPVLVAVTWYFATAAAPFIRETIMEKNHPGKWLIIALSLLLVTLFAAEMINITEIIQVTLR